ncbi:MAG: hypothetical protein RBT41_02600 [Clostridia bacterium]|nr:hypothetical protein [Clostridia bacterium]
MKKILILFLAVLLCLLGGCQKTKVNAPPAEPDPGAVMEEPEDPPESAVLLPVGEITDNAILQKLWEEYFYHTIANVGNTRQFNSAAEIEPMNIAQFAWHKYDTEHGRNTLEQEEGRFSRIFPLETALDYIKRYFNLDSLDVSQINKNSGQYDPERQAFLFNLGEENKFIPYYNSGRDWSIKLTSVVKNADGTVTAVLTHFDYQHKDRAEYTRTYTLQEREDGSLYFLTGKWEYINNNLAKLSGDYQRFDMIAGFNADPQEIWKLQELRLLGEFGGKVLFTQTSYNEGSDGALLLVNPDKMAVEKRLSLPGKIYISDVRLLDDKVLVYLNDRFIVTDPELSATREILLPTALAARIAREEKYDINGIPDIYFGGYDVSADLQKIAYADEIGLKLLDLADGSEKLLAESVPVKSDLMKASYHRSPRFVADEQKVITTMTAYEGTMGYTLCDLNTGEVRKYDISSEGSSTGAIRYDNGLLEVNAYQREGTYKSLYLDFRTGEVQELAVNEPGDTGYIRFIEQSFVGKNYASYITTEHDNMNNDNNMAYLNRVNLQTFQVEEQVISVKAAQVYLLGVLADGRIIFWYSLNPSEYGVCITQ